MHKVALFSGSASGGKLVVQSNDNSYYTRGRRRPPTLLSVWKGAVLPAAPVPSSIPAAENCCADSENPEENTYFLFLRRELGPTPAIRWTAATIVRHHPAIGLLAKFAEFLATSPHFVHAASTPYNVLGKLASKESVNRRPTACSPQTWETRFSGISRRCKSNRRFAGH